MAPIDRVPMNPSFEYVFPTIRGIQARREYYVSMCPLRLIPKVFLFDEDELNPELRAQRTLNRARLPEIARYITDNRDGYVFSALTASIDGNVRFEAVVRPSLLEISQVSKSVGKTTRGEIVNCLGSPRATTSGRSGDVATWVAANSGLWFISGSARTASITFRADVASNVERSDWR